MKDIVSFFYALVAHLGAFGLILVGIFDSSFLFMPLGNDLLVLGLTARQPHKLFYYAAMATVGSELGCAIVDWIARKGGEEGLHRVLPARRMEYVKRKVSENAGFAIGLASVMPPPFPFTPFIAAAAAFNYPRKKLFTILAVTRFARFSAIGLLGILFGQTILKMAELPAVRYSLLGLIVICLVGSVLSVYGWIRRSRKIERR